MEPYYWTVSAVIALIPGALYALWFYLGDIYEREPYGYVLGVFLWGAVPGFIMSMYVERVLGSTWIHDQPMLFMGIAVPLVEETVKTIALVTIYMVARQEFDGPLDGLIYGALVGFGFAMAENLTYFVAVARLHEWVNLISLALFRVVVFGLSHATYTAVSGIGLGIARHSNTNRKKLVVILGSWMIAIALHGAHNLSGRMGGIGGLIAVMLALVNIFGIYIAFQRGYQVEVSILKAQLQEEIGAILTRNEYENLIAAQGRPTLLDSPNPVHSARLRLAVELANRKHRLNTRGAHREPELPGDILIIREKIASL